jgi:hypothetical protein
MTMREHMKKPITRAALYTAVVGAGAAAGLVHYPWRLTVAILVGWAFAIITVMLWRTRCPVCNSMFGAKTRSISKDNCPHYGVNFELALKSQAYRSAAARRTRNVDCCSVSGGNLANKC